MSKNPETTAFHFEGFDNPTTTPVPDVLFDLLLPELSEAELRVLLYIIRRTFGFKKQRDDISLRQLAEGITTRDGKVLDRGAGVGKTAAVRAVKGLEAKGIITATRNQSPEKGHEPTTYALHFRVSQAPLFTKGTRGGSPREQALVHQGNTQQTVVQQTDIHNSNIRKTSARREDRGEWSDPRGEDSDASRSDSITPARTSSRAAEATEPADTPPAARGGLEPIGTTLARRRGSRAAAVATDDADRPLIVAYLEDFSREFGDKAKLRHSVSRALNLYHQAGCSHEVFISAMYQARAKTKEATKVNNRMAYWFRCVEDVLGLKDDVKGTTGKTYPPGSTNSG